MKILASSCSIDPFRFKIPELRRFNPLRNIEILVGMPEMLERVVVPKLVVNYVNIDPPTGAVDCDLRWR